MRRMHARWMVSVTAAMMTAVALAAAPAALAAPVLPSQDAFYSYSGSLAGVAPGTVLRSRSVSLAESGTTTPVTASQVLYRTTGQLGQPTVTVATIIRPAVTAAPVKIVSYQTAYDALGSQCDPSYTLQGGNSSYSTAQAEEQVILGYVSAGDTVVVPDYEGEKLDWGAGQESGYDTLDAIRATEHLLGVPAKTTPVGMVGYSGGSIATDMAGELAGSYAPELDIVGSAEGGIPADYFHNLTYINGSTGWAGVIPAVLVSLSRAYDISFQQYLSPYGQQVTGQVQSECINSFAGNYPGLTIQQLLKPQYQDYTKIHDLVAIGDHMIMSRTGTPRGPLFMGVGDSDGTGDGIMVTADDVGLAHTYCQRGVSVQLNVYSGADHTQAAVPFEAGAAQFLAQRLAGLPVPNGCGSIGAGNSLAPLPVPAAVTVTGAGPRRRGPSRRALTFSFGAGRRCVRGLVLHLASVHGTLTHVVVTLSRGRRRVALRRIERLTRRRRRLILTTWGHAPSAGRYTLRVSEGGLTLLTRTVRVRGRAACTRARARTGPRFTG